MIGEMLESYRNVPKSQVRRRLDQIMVKKFVSLDNPGQNIWCKVKRYNKIGQDFKNLISNFACFLTSIVNV